MRRRGTKRKWAATALTVALVVAHGPFTALVQLGPFMAGLDPGVVVWLEGVVFQGPVLGTSDYKGIHTYPFGWFENGSAIVPLWPLLLPSTLLTLWLWRRNRFPAGSCRQCGYNMTGSTSGVCPECGTATSMEPQP